MHLAENRTVLELTLNGPIHPRIAVAENDRPKRHQIVQVLVVVGVPHPGPFAAHQIVRGDAADPLIGTLGESLCGRRDYAPGAFQQVLGAGDVGHVRFHWGIHGQRDGSR